MKFRLVENRNVGVKLFFATKYPVWWNNITQSVNIYEELGWNSIKVSSVTKLFWERKKLRIVNCNTYFKPNEHIHFRRRNAQKWGNGKTKLEQRGEKVKWKAVYCLSCILSVRQYRHYQNVFMLVLVYIQHTTYIYIPCNKICTLYTHWLYSISHEHENYILLLLVSLVEYSISCEPIIQKLTFIEIGNTDSLI